MNRIFVLSPARTNGKRASMLMSDSAEFDLAQRLRAPEGASLGEVFSFLSGLYFRGKITYSTHFGRPTEGVAAHYVITSNAGLMCPEELVTVNRLRAFSEVPIDLLEPRYTKPLQETVAELKQKIPTHCELVLLGSIATDKYAEILAHAFGPRLLFPREFIGRGDMSRGGLMLRSVRADLELEYISLSEVKLRRGKRPPKLPREGK